MENFPRHQWISPNLWSFLIILLLLHLGVPSAEVYSTPHQELLVNTDQAKYQKGDQVRVWAVLPVLQSDILISFEVDDPNAQPLLILSKITNTSGIAEINFSLSLNAAIGIYDVYASTANETGMISFEVTEITTTTTTTTTKPASTTEPITTTTTATMIEETTTTGTTAPPSGAPGFGILSVLSLLAILLLAKRLHHK